MKYGLASYFYCNSRKICISYYMDFLDQGRFPPRNLGGNATIGTDPFPFQIEQGIDKGKVHQYMMIIAWMAAGNIGLWSLAFKQYKCAIYVHAFCMAALNILTWMSGFMAIIEWGIHGEIGEFHTWLGIALLITIALQSFGGATTWLLQKSAKVKPTVVYVMNWIHRILGFVLLIMATVQILVVTKYNNKIFIPVLVISVVSWVFYLLYKFCRPNMQGYSVLSNQANPNVNVGRNILGTPLIQNSQDLAKLGGEYFIFSDQVYDIHNVLANHPGGYELIKNIKGREVDRYIYGSEPLQAVKKMYLHGHTSSSMKLAGEPLAVFNSLVPFFNMQEINQVSIQRLAQPWKSSSLYAPYLVSNQSNLPFQFNGYENVSQLGKYYAVTINDNLTRLYSVVNFLHLRNVEFLSKLIGKKFTISPPTTSQQIQLSERAMERTKFDQINSIPLLIKKYQKGKFTHQFLGQNFRGKVKISKPLGRGLNLQQIPAGQLIFFAGGTGINPFCDVIDILFKQFLVFQGNALSNQIIRLNPILKNRPVILSKYLISLFYSVRDADQLNDITANQLDRLAENKIITAYVRTDKNQAELFRSYRNLGKLDRKFEQYVPQLARRLDRISQIYVCGPPAMSASLFEAFGQNRIPNFKYKIM